jgi:hypothetical protein
MGQPTRDQILAWSIFWIALLALNLSYFKGDHYPQRLLALWTILFTLLGIAIFFLQTKAYRVLIRRRRDGLTILAAAIGLSFFAAYIWSLFEPILSWLINPAILRLHMKWDLNARGAFPKTFILAFFSVLYIFNQTAQRAANTRGTPRPERAGNPLARGTVLVNAKNDIIPLAIAHIKKISIYGNYSIIVDNENKKYEIKKTLKKWQEELAADRFIRIHRSTLINATYIEKIEPWHNHTLRIKLAGLAEPEEVSRRYAALLKKQMRL